MLHSTKYLFNKILVPLLRVVFEYRIKGCGEIKPQDNQLKYFIENERVPRLDSPTLKRSNFTIVYFSYSNQKLIT